MPEKLKDGVACLYCARPLSKWQFCFINRLPAVSFDYSCTCYKMTNEENKYLSEKIDHCYEENIGKIEKMPFSAFVLPLLSQ